MIVARKEKWDNLEPPQLKSLLGAFGLATDGTTEALVARLEAASAAQHGRALFACSPTVFDVHARFRRPYGGSALVVVDTYMSRMHRSDDDIEACVCAVENVVQARVAQAERMRVARAAPKPAPPRASSVTSGGQAKASRAPSVTSGGRAPGAKSKAQPAAAATAAKAATAAAKARGGKPATKRAKLQVFTSATRTRLALCTKPNCGGSASTMSKKQARCRGGQVTDCGYHAQFKCSVCSEGAQSFKHCVC